LMLLSVLAVPQRAFADGGTCTCSDSMYCGKSCDPSQGGDPNSTSCKNCLATLTCCGSDSSCAESACECFCAGDSTCTATCCQTYCSDDYTCLQNCSFTASCGTTCDKLSMTGCWPTDAETYD